MRLRARETKGVVEFGAALELVEEGDVLLDDVADLAQALLFGPPLPETTGRIRRLRSSRWMRLEA